jgi:hypothetical protein
MAWELGQYHPWPIIGHLQGVVIGTISSMNKIGCRMSC